MQTTFFFAIASRMTANASPILPSGASVVGAVEEDLVDLRLRHEGLDLDRPGVLSILSAFEVAVLDHDVLALGDLV